MIVYVVWKIYDPHSPYCNRIKSLVDICATKVRAEQCICNIKPDDEWTECKSDKCVRMFECEQEIYGGNQTLHYLIEEREVIE